MAPDDTQIENAKKGDEEPITNRDVVRLHWKVIALMAACILFLADYAVTNIINSPHRRIDKLVEDVADHHMAIDKVNEKILNIKNNDANCITRQGEIEDRLNTHERRYDALRTKVLEYQAETKRRDDTQEWWIRNFMGMPD